MLYSPVNKSLISALDGSVFLFCSILLLLFLPTVFFSSSKRSIETKGIRMLDSMYSKMKKEIYSTQRINLSSQLRLRGIEENIQQTT